MTTAAEITNQALMHCLDMLARERHTSVVALARELHSVSALMHEMGRLIAHGGMDDGDYYISSKTRPDPLTATSPLRHKVAVLHWERRLEQQESAQDADAEANKRLAALREMKRTL